MTFLTISIVSIVSIVLNFILFLNHKILAKINNIFDIPDNKRKIHKKPIPLIGGLIIYINLLIFTILNLFFNIETLNIFTNTIQLVSFILIISLFFFLGRIDDKKDLSSFSKFIAMSIFIVASIILDKDLLIKNVVFSFIDKTFHIEKFSFFFTVLCFLLFINAFNMLDGINAQAATYTLIIFIIFILKGIYLPLLIFISICLFIYVFFNLKNLMFLGDSGSLILGFLISYICIKSYNQGNIINTDEIFFLMCVPGYELLRLFVKRILIGKNPFSADTHHLHHYLIKKFSFANTFIFIQIIIFLPILSFLILRNFYISLCLSLVSYFLALFFLRK